MMDEGFLRWPELRPLIANASRTTVWRWEKRGEFPRRCKLSRNVVGWPRASVLAWIADKQANGDAA